MVATGSSLASADEPAPGSQQSTSGDQQTVESLHQDKVANGTSASSDADNARVAARTSRKRPVNITNLNIRNHAVRRSGGQLLVGHAKFKHHKSYDWFSGKAAVFRGKHRVGTATVYSSGNVYFKYHPKSDKRGKFRVGGTHIKGYRKNNSTFNYWDHTKGNFHVRSAIKGNLRIRRHGRKLTFKSHVKYYNTNKTKWKGYKTKAYIQVRRHHHWKRQKKIHLNRKGRDKYVLHRKHKRRYRLKVPKTGKIMGGHTYRSIKI